MSDKLPNQAQTPCIHCGVDLSRFMFNSIFIKDDKLLRTIYCEDCNKAWHDIYTYEYIESKPIG